MVLEGFSIRFRSFWGGMDMALPWSPPDLETNEKLPYDSFSADAFYEITGLKEFNIQNWEDKQI